jgi:hypothetical protein
MDPPTSVYTQGMKSKTLVLALGVLLMPIMANGQSPDVTLLARTRKSIQTRLNPNLAAR